MNDFSQDAERRLLHLLERQRETMERILVLTTEETRILDADDIDGFNLSLNRRQEVIEEFDGLHQESVLLMQSYTAFLSGSDAGRRETVDAALAALESVTRQADSQNKMNVAAAREKAAGFSERIARLNMKRKSLGAYIQNVSENAELFDKKT